MPTNFRVYSNFCNFLSEKIAMEQLEKAKEWAKPVEATGIQKALVGIFRLSHSETDSKEGSTSHDHGGGGG